MFSIGLKAVGASLVKGFEAAQHVPAVRQAERSAARAAAKAIVAHLPEDKRAIAREVAAALVEHLDELNADAGKDA